MSSKEKKFILNYFIFNIIYFVFSYLIPPFPPFYEDDSIKIFMVGTILVLFFLTGIQSIIFCLFQLPKQLEKNGRFLFFQLLNTLMIHFICIDGVMYGFQFEFTIIHLKEILILSFIYYIGFLVNYLKNIKTKS